MEYMEYIYFYYFYIQHIPQCTVSDFLEKSCIRISVSVSVRTGFEGKHCLSVDGLVGGKDEYSSSP